MNTIATIIIIILVLIIVRLLVSKPQGELQIDSSNPDKDVYRFVVYGDVEDLSKKRSVRFKVLPDVDMSREEHTL